MGDDLKTRWVKALRSGRYRQTTQRLASDLGKGEENCCLGVLCRVARVGPGYRDRSYLSQWKRGKRLMDRVGMDDGAEARLMNLNDHEGQSFAEIADYIEANL